MSNNDLLREFLSRQEDITLDYSEINFLQPERLEKDQVGYSFDPKGKSLITGKKGDWQTNWTVIASDGTGDPILVDTETPGLRVLTAAHGMRSWNPEPIADSLESFAALLDKLRVLAVDRENPVKKKLNPLTAQEAEAFLEFVRTANPNSDPTYWEVIMGQALENDTE
jgi:hypothetical protein